MRPSSPCVPLPPGPIAGAVRAAPAFRASRRGPGIALPKRRALCPATHSVGALPATGGDAVYRGRDLAGFGASSAKAARSPSFSSGARPGEAPALGPVAGKAIDQRRREATRVIDRIRRGLDPDPPELEPGPTAADLATCFLRGYVKVHRKPKTETLYRTAIDRHIVLALDTKSVKLEPAGSLVKSGAR